MLHFDGYALMHIKSMDGLKSLLMYLLFKDLYLCERTRSYRTNLKITFKMHRKARFKRIIRYQVLSSFFKLIHSTSTYYNLQKECNLILNYFRMRRRNVYGIVRMIMRKIKTHSSNSNLLSNYTIIQLNQNTINLYN